MAINADEVPVRRKQIARAFLVAFCIGMLAPLLTSIFSILVSFDLGTKVAVVLAPPILMADHWPDGAIPVVNGLLYGSLAMLFRFLLPKKP